MPGQTGGERGFDRIEICKHIIGEAVFSNCLPKMLDRIELGTVGRRHEQAHVLRHEQFACQMSARLAHDHEDKLVSLALREL